MVSGLLVKWSGNCEVAMQTSALGKVYRDGEIIIHQGEVGECMYVIQAGKVEVLSEADGKQVRLSVLGDSDVFGEMALLDREARSATVVLWERLEYLLWIRRRSCVECMRILLWPSVYCRKCHAEYES